MIKLLKQIVAFLFEGHSAFNLLMCMVWATPLISFSHGILNKMPIIGSHTDFIIIGTEVLIIFFSLSYIVRRLKFGDILFYVLWLVLYLGSMILFPENTVALENRMFRCLCMVIPYYFMGRLLCIEKFEKPFYYLSALCILLSAFYYLIYAQSALAANKEIVGDDNMGASYSLLPHVLMVAWVTFRKPSWVNVLLLLLGCFMMLSYGTRGPIVCLLTFLFIYIFAYLKGKYAKVVRIGLIVATLVCVGSLTFVMTYMQGAMETVGMSTRIFDKFLDEELHDDSGRFELTDTLHDVLLREDGVWGHGLLGSYPYIGTYPHNIFDDFIFTFGYIWGIGLLLALVCLIVIAYRKSPSMKEKEWIVLLTISVGIKLCFSGTYLDDTLFFMLIGYCFSALVNKSLYQTHTSDMESQIHRSNIPIQ